MGESFHWLFINNSQVSSALMYETFAPTGTPWPKESSVFVPGRPQYVKPIGQLSDLITTILINRILQIYQRLK